MIDGKKVLARMHPAEREAVIHEIGEMIADFTVKRLEVSLVEYQKMNKEILTKMEENHKSTIRLVQKVKGLLDSHLLDDHGICPGPFHDIH
jgi:hypothetical protein